MAATLDDVNAELQDVNKLIRAAKAKQRKQAQDARPDGPKMSMRLLHIVLYLCILAGCEVNVPVAYLRGFGRPVGTRRREQSEGEFSNMEQQAYLDVRVDVLVDLGDSAADVLGAKLAWKLGLYATEHNLFHFVVDASTARGAAPRHRAGR